VSKVAPKVNVKIRVDELIGSAGKLDKLSSGVKQGRISNLKAQDALEALSKYYGVELKPGQSSFSTRDLYVGIHKSTGTVKSNGASTIDINQGGKIYKIRFE